MRGHLAVLVLTALTISVSAPCLEAGECQTLPPTNKDIVFMDREEVGARWAGIGGACIALVDDGNAAFWNPAGLGKIRRIELLGGMNWRDQEIQTLYYGGSNTSTVSKTRFENFAFSYPFPTYRGSLVLTGAVYRTTSVAQYLNRAGECGGDDIRDIEERDVALTAWSGAIAVQISPRVFVGLEGHLNSGDMTLTDTYYPWGECPWPGGIFDVQADLGGWGGKFGFVYLLHEMASFGMVVKFPERIRVDGTELVTEESDPCLDAEYSISYDIDLPWSFGFGLGLTPPGFMIGFDVVHNDWGQLNFPGEVRDPVTGAYYYDATTDLRVGVEYSLPMAPVRVWGGYAYVPLELNLFEIEKNRNRFSLGAGMLVEKSLTVDFTWQRTTSERTDTEPSDPAYSYWEKREIDRAIISLAFRF